MMLEIVPGPEREKPAMTLDEIHLVREDDDTATRMAEVWLKTPEKMPVIDMNVLLVDKLDALLTASSGRRWLKWRTAISTNGLLDMLMNLFNTVLDKGFATTELDEIQSENALAEYPNRIPMLL